MTGAEVRRILHALTAGILLIVPLSSWVFFRGFVIALAVTAAAVDALRRRHAGVRQVLTRYVPVFRTAELTRASGAVWLMTGYAIASWAPPRPAVAGILVAALADPVASAVGSMGKRSSGKTWRGTSAAVLVAGGVLWVIGLPILPLCVIALLAGMLERWPGPFDDNVVLAPGVAAAVWVAGGVFA